MKGMFPAMVERMASVAKSHRGFLLLVAGLVAFGFPALGQTSASAPQNAPKMATAYEVVSVKPAKPGCGMYFSTPPGWLTAHCVTVWGLIYNAYKVRSFSDYPPGLPGWADKEVFDVDAKTDSQTEMAMQRLPQAEGWKQTQLMLRSLLADRFHLRIHYETKVEPIYELLVAKGGPNLKHLQPDQQLGSASGGPGRITVRGDSMSMFAFFLTQAAGRTVVDKTGLSGNYDLALNWTPDDQQIAPNAGPTLFTALREQLGLQLRSAKGPVQILVIDQVERPSPN